MKKIGFGVIGLILVAVIYYFTAGSGQIRQEIKTQVNNELATLEQNGFAIQDRDIKKSEEHFIIVFDDPKKIVAFFAAQGAQMDIEDASALKGLRIGVDAKYLNDTYSVLSLDIYPLNLPTSITDLDMNKEDKLAVEQLNNILKKKALLVHIDFNKLLSSFKGHVKDIHETLQGENEVKFNIEGVTFEGDIEKGKSLAKHIDSGAVFINGLVKSDPRLPFGGVKTSGYGRELSHYGIKEFVNIKTVWIK